MVSNIFYFHPYLGKGSILTFAYFSNGLNPSTGGHATRACFSTWFPRCRKPFGPAGVSWILGGSADLASSCLTALENSEVGSWGSTTANMGKGGVGYHLRFCTLVNQHNWLENEPFEGYLFPFKSGDIPLLC